MTINKNDDYEKLAKLLYPSIEASGNVYYGQTRKLTLDAIFDRNDLGFKSWISTERVDDDSADYGYNYKTYFNWRVGPLTGRIRFEINSPINRLNYDNFFVTFYNFPDIMYLNIIGLHDNDPNYILWPSDEYINARGWIYDGIPSSVEGVDRRRDMLLGTIFARYKISTTESMVKNIINSGKFNSYEKDLSCSFDGLYSTYGFNPTNRDDFDLENRHFFIESDNTDSYIYVLICHTRLGIEGWSYYTLPIEPLKLTAVSNTATIKLAATEDTVGNLSGVKYKYKLNDDVNFQDYTFGEVITISKNQTVSFKQVEFPSTHNPFNANNYVNFEFGNTDIISASGDLASMMPSIDDNTLVVHTQIADYAAYRIFYNCTQLIKAPKISVLDKQYCTHIFDSTFYNTGISQPPKLLPLSYYDVTSYDYSGTYNEMFSHCQNLKTTGTIYYKKLKGGFTYMFDECPNISTVNVSYATDQDYDVTYFGAIISYVLADSGTFICSQSKDSAESLWFSKAFPHDVYENWELKTESHYPIIWSNSFICLTDNSAIGFITDGSNSNVNGRGDLTYKSTLSNMESSFDVYNTHQMNTYNNDGSYNQEIWGYKSFNSPIQFRNGIYGESGFIISSNDNYDTTTRSITISTYNDNNISENAAKIKLSVDSNGSSRIDLYADHLYIHGTIHKVND